MMRRFFFALVADEATNKNIVAGVQTLQVAKHEKLVRKENIHITLRYIGALTDAVLESIINSVKTIRRPVFRLNIVNYEYWKKQRLSVLTPETVPDDLSDLVDKLEMICTDNGLTKENKVFKPHITIIRNSEDHYTNNNLNQICWEVNDFVLMGSDRIKGKTEYIEIGRWTLLKDHH